MNERIKALVEQARKYADENRPGSFVKYDPEWFVLYNEKFAELIVRECMSIVENYPIDPEDMPYNGRIIPYMIFVQEKMQLHFGVEL